MTCFPICPECGDPPGRRLRCIRDNCPVRASVSSSNELRYTTEGLTPTTGGWIAPKQTILEEAAELVDGDRQTAYGHPYDDASRFIGAFNSLFADHLSRPLELKHWALIQILIKLSREINMSKRDNMVDTAGYARTVEKITERQQELDDERDAGSYG